MAMSRERASLYETLQQSPHLPLVFQSSDGVDHLLLRNPWDGWFTPCKLSLSAHEANLRSVRHGRPTCFECFGEDDPADAGRQGRHAVKLYAERRGQHWHVVMWMGALNETLMNVGGFVMMDFEWREFAAAVAIGGLTLGMRVIIEKEE